MMIKFSIPERLNLLAHKIISTCILSYISNKLLFPVGTTQHCNARIKEDLFVRCRNWVKIWQLFDSLVFTFQRKSRHEELPSTTKKRKRIEKKKYKICYCFHYRRPGDVSVGPVLSIIILLFLRILFDCDINSMPSVGQHSS